MELPAAKQMFSLLQMQQSQAAAAASLQSRLHHHQKQLVIRTLPAAQAPSGCQCQTALLKLTQCQVLLTVMGSPAAATCHPLLPCPPGF